MDVGRATSHLVVLAYDFWLDVHVTSWRRRRELRRELRSNLLAAAEVRGARAAVADLGGVRRLAADVATTNPRRVRWGAGLVAGLVTAQFVLVVVVVLGMAWTEGVRAADPSGAVSGSFAPLDAAVRYAPPTGGEFLLVDVRVGWPLLLVAATAFLVVARPWSAVRSSRCVR